MQNACHALSDALVVLYNLGVVRNGVRDLSSCELLIHNDLLAILQKSVHSLNGHRQQQYPLRPFSLFALHSTGVLVRHPLQARFLQKVPG